MLIILDRDGVINFDSRHYIKSPDEWIPIPDSLRAIALLTQKNYKVVVATNQSGVNRGLFSALLLQKIHEKMINAIEQVGGKIEKIYFCPHRPEENCDCRKPKPGLLHQIAQDFPVKKSEIIYIGDSVKDYEAAQAFGCLFILVRTGNGKKTENHLKTSSKLQVFDNLIGAVEYLIKGP